MKLWVQLYSSLHVMFGIRALGLGLPGLPMYDQARHCRGIAQAIRLALLRLLGVLGRV